MEPIIKFINEVDREKDSENKTYTEIINRAVEVGIDDVKPLSMFKMPPKENVATAKLSRITYQKPTAEFERVKKQLKASSAEEVGLKTFEYYQKFEVE